MVNSNILVILQYGQIIPGVSTKGILALNVISQLPQVMFHFGPIPKIDKMVKLNPLALLGVTVFILLLF